LMAILQYPELVGWSLLARAAHATVANPALAVVRDGIAVYATAASGADGDDLLARVIASVPVSSADLVQQLGVAPIPERQAGDVGAYARSVTAALVARDLAIRKADLLGRLQRADSGDRETYVALQRELVAVEADRRDLVRE
jgi:DNA primase